MGLSDLRPKIFGAIDIGTSAIRAVIASPIQQEWRILGWGAYPSSGIKKGQIIDKDRLMRCIQCTWDQTMLQADPVSFDRFAINISHPALQFQCEHDRTVFSKKKRLTSNDLQDLLTKMSSHKKDSLAIHTLVQAYTLNNSERTLYPLGLGAQSLECDALMIRVPTDVLRSRTECIAPLHLSLTDPVFDGVAVTHAVLSAQDRAQGSLVIDFGAGSTKWALYQNAIPVTMGMMPIGGDQLTADIALALKTSLSTAEILKVRHGAVTASVGSSCSSLYTQKEPGSLALDQHTLDYLNQVMTMRLEEMLFLITADLKKKDLMPLSISSIVLTGGLTKIYGLTSLVEQIFGVPARTGLAKGFTQQAPFFKEPSSATLVGLMQWLYEQELLKDQVQRSGWKYWMHTLQHWFLK